MVQIASAELAKARVLRLLAHGAATVGQAAASGKLLLDVEERGTISVEAGILAELVSAGLVWRGDGTVSLSPEGCSASRRADMPADAFQSQHRDLGFVPVEDGTGVTMALANLSESPLGQLMRRRTKAGDPFLSAAEFTAGERLRADYTRGQIMPRLGANWVASIASGRRGGSGGGLVDLTDAALAARQRVDGALEAVGPELSGVLIDVCCFLKGLELVEMERGWPVRSAKIVLKTALGVLGRHYDPPARARGRAAKVLHWGSEDYRPKIG